MRRNRIINCIVVLLGSSLLTFQACQSWNSANPLGLDISTKSNNNGSSYGGKPSHYRFVPGYSCGGLNTAYARLEIDETQAILVSAANNNCQFSLPIPKSEIELSAYGEKYLGYKDGVYTKRESIAFAKEETSFTEAWCKSDSGEQQNRIDLRSGFAGGAAT